MKIEVEMTKEKLIKKTVETLSKLPQDKILEVNDFADYILEKYDREILQKGIEKIVDQSTSFDFLKDEEELYSIEDLKEKFK
jgi:hypothetical protein